MPTARPMEVGRAAYEAVANDINRRLGHSMLLTWDAIPPADRAAWAAAGRAERAAVGVIPAHPTVEEALAAVTDRLVDAAEWLDRVDPRQRSEESQQVHAMLGVLVMRLRPAGHLLPAPRLLSSPLPPPVTPHPSEE